ncbi:DNRLRE domain-containing protein [Streptacidiphilus carbonis]|uniref:DNRLRE domain-containing protein n=1 Tax=Streptacidiphilus carbonis TaxID=105422 RepID=UPI00069454C2|nr:DNRLRE domain-containing protein [Streptacidiphilus carbonis]
MRIDPHAHRVAELTGRRTAQASFYRLSDGRVQEVLSAVPVHYRDARGAWQTINTQVGKASHDGFTLGATDNAFRSYLSGSGDPSALVRVEQGSAFLQLGVVGGAKGAAKVSGNTVDYPAALPGADLKYHVGSQGVKEDIVLNRAPAPGASFSFTFKVGGFTPKQRRDGSIAFYGSESAHPAFVIPAPYMADSHQDVNSPYGVAYSTKVSQTMAWDAKAGTLRVTVRPDAAWLSARTRQFPVTIDPTILVAPAPSQAANVMVLQDGPSTNYDTSWRLSVGTTPTGAARTLIKFPMPSVPAGTTITSASLKLYYDQYFTTGLNNVAMDAHAATAAWDPTTATWNNSTTLSGALAGSATKAAGVRGVWNTFPVTSTVQGWLNGSAANNGFVVQAHSETTLNQGGPRYEASIYGYGGEAANYPQLEVTYGVPGVAVNPPTVIHSTGAELSWPTYTNTTGNSANDLVEYQVHRSIFQTFTPSASTEVAPVGSGSTAFTDSTAQPTPTSSSDPYGNAYYYMVVVKTASGALIPGPTQLVRLPKAGLTTVLIRQGAATTLSSAQPSTVENTLSDSGLQQPWLEVGDNSATYGTARSVFNFGALPSSIPTNATVSEAHLKLWQFETDTTSSGAVYELHGLTRTPAISQATWNSAATGTGWTAPGGDYSSTAASTVPGLTDDPNRQNFDATSLVQGWVTTPSSNHGLELKLAKETSADPQEHTLFAGTNTAEPLLSPTLVVTYLDPTPANTYYAPTTPAKMVPGSTYTVPVTVNNSTSSTWSASTEKLTYHWTLPDGTDVTSTGDQLTTPLPADMAPGSQQTVNAQVTAPAPTDNNTREAYTLSWDMQNTSTGSYLSTSTGGIGSLAQAVRVNPSGNNQLGLEKFYQYVTTATGSGSALYTNASSGNTVWNYNAFSNPSRGFATFARMSYNSLDTTDSTTGFGWSVQLSTPTRLGTPLDFHPNPNPTEVTFTDGDGTSHVWTWNSTTSTWTSPAGVHLYLQQLAGCGPQVTNARAWLMTRPDRTQFYYDCEGFPTAVVDKNGNESDFTYWSRQSENKPEEFLAYVTDPTGRKTLTVNYYAKGDSYSYIDSTGTLQSGTNLTDPQIIDHVKSVTDVSGRTIDFYYTTNGLMARMVDGAGDSAAKTFNFSYDATQGMKNVKLVKITDPRGHSTSLSYYDPVTDPKFHWWTQSVTDRLGHSTNFAYTEPGTITNSAIQTTITDANSHTTSYELDSNGRLLQSTDPLNQKTTLGWDADNNVSSLTEANGAVSTWTYDPNTGYPLTHKDALANKNNTAGESYTYQTSLSGHIADITDKVSAAGRHWHFGYDTHGNLTSLQNPDGTAAGSGYTTSYSYDSSGEPLTVTDANSNTTQYSDYDPSGYPKTITDPLGNATQTVYGPRGEVTSVTDALGHATTQNYDVFGRALDGRTPKDQANGVYVTTPAPVYDANDNVTQKTAPNGAASTASYDADDELTASTTPPDTSSGAAPTTSYTYDAVGNRLTATSPDGNVPGAAAGSYTTTTAYDSDGQPVSVTDALGDKSTSTYDSVGNAVQVTDPLGHITKTSFDVDHRPLTSTDAAGNTGTIGYDADGTVTSTTDQNGNTTLDTVDPLGQTTQVQVPHTSSGGTISYDTSKYVYDQVGNLTQVVSPRGVASGTSGAFTTRTVYDKDNRKSAEFGAYDPNDSSYNTAPETDYTYDAAGRLTKVTTPASGGQSVRNTTTYSLWDNGWLKASTDPWGITSSYDYNALGQQSARTITSAGGSSSRTQSWSYLPDGKLASRSDTGVPVGLQVELVDNSDTQNTSSTGTWTSSSTGTGYNGYDYATHTAGSGTDAFSWNLTVPEDGNYTVYAQYPSVTGAATNAQYTVNYNGGTSTATVDQTKNAGTWVSLGSFAFTQAGTGQKISLAQNSGGSVSADAVKIVRDNSGDTQPKPDALSYTYDANGNMTGVADSSPNAQYDAYAFNYDGLDRLTQLQEKLSGTVKHTTAFTFDANGNSLTETHDGAGAAYTYDVRDLLTKVVNKETANDPNPRTTSWTYSPTARIATESKANGNTVSSTYNLDDSLAGTVEKTSGGTVVAQHTLSYDPDLNQTQDVSTTQNADNHSATLDRTAIDTYTPRDQIESVTNSDGHGDQSYTYDLAGNITAQTVSGVSRTNVYDRNRLLTSTANGTTESYNYDPFGRTDAVHAAGTAIQRYTYDGFDRVASEQQDNGTGPTTTTYSYDAFDRSVSQTTASGTSSAKTTAFDYLGTSKALVGEEVGGTPTKTYQYSPTGERLDQIVHNTDGTEDPSYYSYNQHTDVQAITDSSGNTKATYGYTAYGQDDTSQDTGVDKPSSGQTGTSDPYNAYRFNSDRIDGSTGTYNMGFRTYDPGMNRFLTRDMYAGALSDMGMSADPYTGNRYAFGGGNPISNVELDGHNWFSDAVSSTASWVSDNADNLVSAAGHTAEIIAGAGAIDGGFGLIATGIGTCVLGGIETLGAACVAGGAEVVAGVGAITVGTAAVINGAVGLNNDITAMRTSSGGSSGGSGGSGSGLRTPKAGDSDNGPGKWVEVNRGGGSSSSWDYQEKVTGVTRDREYEIDGVKMDGWDGSTKTILEAKDQYAQFVKNGQFKSWWQGKQALLNEAKSQIAAAQKYGLNLRWTSASQDFVDAMQALLKENNVAGRNMIDWVVKPN